MGGHMHIRLCLYRKLNACFHWDDLQILKALKRVRCIIAVKDKLPRKFAITSLNMRGLNRYLRCEGGPGISQL